MSPSYLFLTVYSSSRLSPCVCVRSIARELLTGRTELCEIVDRLSGLTGVRSKQGFMGVVTNNLLPRAECYEQGVIFAFAPFISSPVYWS